MDAHTREITLYDNAGPNIRGLSKDDVTAQEELTAFDQLGPFTRKVISELMCVPWSSHNVLHAIKQDWRADPLNPSIDRKVAEMLLRANAEVAAELRPRCSSGVIRPASLREPREAEKSTTQNGSQNFS
jgi:hypothetical protein